jgi:small subunit ribosomal protein S8
MSMHDPIADMFTRIRNAQKAHHDSVTIPYSKFKIAILKVLNEEGYVAEHEIVTNSAGHKQIELSLRYYNNLPVIDRIERLSKPGLRKYASYTEMRPIPGYGVAIVSTSKGVMTHKKARSLKLGGELIGLVA